MKTAWVRTTLGEIAEIVSGATPKTSVAEYWGGGIPWVTPKELSGLEGPSIASTGRTLTEAGLKSCAASLLPPRSVLLSSRAPIGLVAINDVPMATNQGFKSLVPDDDRVDSKFLYWWLRHHRARLEAMGNGATFKEVSKKIVDGVAIDLPPIEEQRRIAAVLDAAEALWATRRQALTKLRALTQAIFIDMFGNRHAGESGPLEQYVDVVTKGTTPTSVGFEFTESGVPFVRVQDLVAGSVALDRIELFVSEKTNEALARSILLPNDVLISIAGTIGRVALVPRDAPTLNCNQAVALVRTGQDLEPVYLAAWLNTPEAQEQMLGSRVTGTISNLSLANIRSLRISVPAIDRQRRFAEVIGEVEILRDSLLAHADALDTLFASLQQRAFRGEL